MLALLEWRNGDTRRLRDMYVYSTFTFAFYSRRRKELEWRHQDIYETTSLPPTPFLGVVARKSKRFYEWNTDKL